MASDKGVLRRLQVELITDPESGHVVKDTLVLQVEVLDCQPASSDYGTTTYGATDDDEGSVDTDDGDDLSDGSDYAHSGTPHAPSQHAYSVDSTLPWHVRPDVPCLKGLTLLAGLSSPGWLSVRVHVGVFGVAVLVTLTPVLFFSPWAGLGPMSG